MTPTRILPDLQCSLMCEEIRQEANGNFFLIGVINFIRVPQLPVVAFKLSVFNRWTAGIGQFTESVRLIAPDQTTVLRKGEVKFALQDAAYQRDECHAVRPGGVQDRRHLLRRSAGGRRDETALSRAGDRHAAAATGGQNPKPPEAAPPA